jgi:hypothetical protein
MNRYPGLRLQLFGFSGKAEPLRRWAKPSAWTKMLGCTPEGIDLVVIKTHLSLGFA